MRISVWWALDKCSYSATIDRLSISEIELIYEDGLREVYQRDGDIESRISRAQVLKRW